MQNTANSLSRTGGWGSTPQVGGMGGFNSQMPQWGQNTTPPQQPQPQPQPQQQGMGPMPPGGGNPQQGQPSGFNPQQLGAALGQMSGGGQGGMGSPYGQLGQQINGLLQQKPWDGN